MKPGDQILYPQVVVPYYTKNSKTDFWASDPKMNPITAPTWQKVALICDSAQNLPTYPLFPK